MAAITTYSRRAVIRRGIFALSALASLPVLARTKVEVDTIEMYIDFGCPHCFESYQIIQGAIPLLEAKNIFFEMRPVLPAKITSKNVSPAPVTRFFYSVLGLSSSNQRKLVTSLFRGMSEGPEMGSFKSIYQRVMFVGLKLDYEKVKKECYLFRPRSKFLNAVNNNKVVLFWPWNTDSKTTTHVC